MKRSLYRKTTLLALIFGALGCGARTSPPGFAVTFRIVADDGAALAGIAVSARGRLLGSTGTAGELHVSIGGGEGEVIPVSIECGTKHRSPDHLPGLKLTTIRRITSHPAEASIPYEAVCTRMERNVVVVARAEKQPGIPVTIEGKQVALTDGDGNAHVLVPLDAKVTVLHVGFETSGRPELLPRNPSRACDVASGDGIVTLEQKFTLSPKPVPRRFVSQPKRIPVRIE